MERQTRTNPPPHGEVAPPTGRTFWRSLDELAEDGDLRAELAREFPDAASLWPEGVSRREFLQLMGASLALAGVGGGCSRQPDETIIPYVRRPEDALPGVPQYFATAQTLGGYARGILVESHTGRPTKVEGNPNHPASLGATDVWMQAHLLGLYDPDRSQAVQHLGQISTWSSFLAHIERELTAWRAREGAGVHLVTGNVTSPSLAAQVAALRDELPQANWYQYEPTGPAHARLGARMALGRSVQTIYRFDQADRVLSLDADFLLGDPASVRYARDFMSRRRVRSGAPPPRPEHRPPPAVGFTAQEAQREPAEMNRLYVVEPGYSITGAMADHRFPMPAQQISGLAERLAEALGVAGARAEETAAGPPLWLRALVEDLRAHAGRCLVLAGESQPPRVHALVHHLNAALGNIGRTVVYTEPIEPQIELRDNPTLVLLGVNPVYDAPAELRFGEQLPRVRQRFHWGLYVDETARLCHWHVPASHELESWGDARAFDGTVSMIQPLIAPLYSTYSAHEFVAALGGESTLTNYRLVRDFWQQRVGEEGFERWWRRVVHDGVMPGTAAAVIEPALRPRPLADRAAPPAAGPAAGAAAAGTIEVVFKPDPTIYDGRYANNGWLQELPKTLSKLTWDNAVLLSVATARELGVSNGDVVELSAPASAGRPAPPPVEGPVWVLPGHADGCATVFLGYGREFGGRIATGAGFNAYRLRPSDGLGYVAGVAVTRTRRRQPLACTQTHYAIEGRDLVRVTTPQRFDTEASEAAGIPGPDVPLRRPGRDVPLPLLEPPPRGASVDLGQPSLFPPDRYEAHHKWGMVIDLTSCIGCNACTVACQSENNVPIVGREQVRVGREMHWLRIDRYFETGQGLANNTQRHVEATANPAAHFQPMLCQQCEKAPCEVVCPVAATVHSAEGLNDMVYNRCVGTRYCSNNCPYKVRRFNFLQYADTSPLQMLRYNPDVTVRSRGVMEKCTYCVQRISRGRIEAKKEGRRVADGEVLTACQQACPTEAIVFGDLNDPESRVHWMWQQPHRYGLLLELNTQPRTTFLSRLRNPNPAIADPQHAPPPAGHGHGPHTDARPREAHSA